MHSSIFPSCKRLLLISGCVFYATVSTGLPLSAEPKASQTVNIVKEAPKKAKEAKKESKSSTSLSPQREKQALEFARSHHPELAELIQRLKKHRPREYKRAVRELDTTLTRLERFKDRDSDRYQLILERWEIDSRIRLLAARVSVKGTDAEKSELTSLIKQRVDLQLDMLRLEKKSTEKRLQKLDKSISEIEENRDRLIESELKKIKRTMKKSGSKTNNKK